MRAASIWSLALVLAAALPAQAQTRSEVPIRQVDLSDGERRYAVMLKLGGTQIEAGLDSGSTGLRILPGVLQPGDAKGGGGSDHYAYGSGTEFVGETGKGLLTIGGASGAISVQLIKTKQCVDRQPNCPASKIPMEQFGIQGSGIPGAGFKAIFGINMSDAEIDSPLSAIGVKRWIIELPRAAAETGRLILNPTDEEVKDYALLPIDGHGGGLHDAVKGCILNRTTKANACGALTLDTGAPGISIISTGIGPAALPEGASAAFGFYDGRTARAMESFTVGARAHAAKLSFPMALGRRDTVIRSGLSAYFAFDVLYDSRNAKLGLKPRPPAGDSPTGTLAPP